MIAGRGSSTNIMFNYLKDHFQLNKVIIENSVSKKAFIRNRIRNLGIIKVTGQILFQVLIVPFLKMSAKNRIKQILKKNQLNGNDIPQENIIYTESINSNHALEQIKAIAPKIIVVSGCRIISQKILNAVNCKVINIHAGITPKYRGVHGGYWALRENDSGMVGTTLHYVDPGVDTGEIIDQSNIEITSNDNFVSYPILQLAEGLFLLSNYLKTEKINERINHQDSESSVWYHPTLLGYLYNRLTKGIK